MTFTKLTKERLEQYASDPRMCNINDEIRTMAREILEYRADAEPVGWTDEQELRGLEKRGCAYLFKVNPISPNADPRRVIKPYTQPQPAPVVPNECTDKQAVCWMHSMSMSGNYRDGWNDCRAAMLQGKAEPVSQSYTVPEGYALVPVEPTIAMLDEFDSIIDYGADDSNDAWSRLLAAAWIKSLPAAPQQEVKP